MITGYYCINIECINYMFDNYDKLFKKFEKNFYIEQAINKNHPVIFYYEDKDWAWDHYIHKDINGKYVNNYGESYKLIGVEQLIRREKLKRILE